MIHALDSAATVIGTQSELLVENHCPCQGTNPRRPDYSNFTVATLYNFIIGIQIGSKLTNSCKHILKNDYETESLLLNRYSYTAGYEISCYTESASEMPVILIY
jgi:hypothetical protein